MPAMKWGISYGRDELHFCKQGESYPFYSDLLNICIVASGPGVPFSLPTEYAFQPLFFALALQSQILKPQSLIFLIRYIHANYQTHGTFQVSGKKIQKMRSLVVRLDKSADL